jgi:hypothetical protein
LPAGKVTGTNREVEAVVAASFAARTAASVHPMQGDEIRALRRWMECLCVVQRA